MYRRGWSRRRHGYALVIVMGLLAVLGIMALSLGAATRVDLAQTRRFQDETAAELLSRAGVEWTTSYLHTLVRQGTLWQAPWTTQATQFRGRSLGRGLFDIQYIDASGMWHDGLQDEEARVNLNTASVALLAALPGIGLELAEKLVAHRQETPWQTPEEIVQDGLITPSVWHGADGQGGLKDYLTVWGSGKINVNTAPALVLAAVPGMTSPMLEAIMRYRSGQDQQPETSDDQRFHTLADLSQLPEIGQSGLGQLASSLTVAPSAFRLVATGRVLAAAHQTRAYRRLVVLEHTAQGTALRYGRQLVE